MPNPQSLQLRVGVDVGSQCHSVAVGLTDGSLLDEFEIPHTAAGFRDFFARIEGHATRHPYPIAVAMEGYNGHVRPLDSLVRAWGWRVRGEFVLTRRPGARKGPRNAFPK